MYKGHVNEICFKVCLRGTDRVFECTQPICITCEFATKNHQTFLSIYIYFNDFSKTGGARCGSIQSCLFDQLSHDIETISNLFMYY